MTTVVFADLVGSTSMFEQLGDETASHFVAELVDTLSDVFRQHRGRVVKRLGDGLLVVFPDAGDAVTACSHIQKNFHERPIHPEGSLMPVQMQMGIEAGEVVEIDGDCFGDTVNSAARLAGLAGAAQILTTQKVWAALAPAQQGCLRSLGPIYLRGRVEASHVYRVEWQRRRDEDATMMGRSMWASPGAGFLELNAAGQTVRLEAGSSQIFIGRAVDADLSLNDPRVSRMHATVVWRGGQFMLGDVSSFGTWVYAGNQREGVVLRRTECCLVGSGEIVPGCQRGEDQAPLIRFSIQA